MNTSVICYSLHAVNLQDSIRRQKGIWREKQKTWNATPPSERRECVWAKCVHLEVQKKSWISHRNLFRSLAGRYRVFITSVLSLHLHPKKAQRQMGVAMLWNSSSSGLISNQSLFVTKIPISTGGEGEDYFHFLDRDWPPVFYRHSSLLFFLWLPAFSPLHWVYPTTRWRRVFCSGNSVCRTHCWLSGVLWLFRLSPGASGPTVRVLYHPSGLGTGSGSWENKRERKA